MYSVAKRGFVACLLVAVALVVPAQQALADTVTHEVYWDHPGSHVCTDDGLDLSVVMSTTMSNTDYSIGDRIRVTFRVEWPGKQMFQSPEPDAYGNYGYRGTGVSKIQGGWSGQTILDWGPEQDGTTIQANQSGSSVIWRARPDVVNEPPNNQNFGPGQTFWIEYSAPQAGTARFWPGGIATVSNGTSYEDFETQVDQSGCAVFREPETEDPVAGFTWSYAAAGSNEVRFTNTSSHPDELPMTYRWTFGDGQTSTATNPRHTYPDRSERTVTLRATDTAGNFDEYSLQVPEALTVNSTGDGSLEDADSDSCDTGGTIGDDPECTLRAAIEAANNREGGEIEFDIDAGGAVPELLPTTLYPDIEYDTIIDGTTQPGGSVRINGINDGVTPLDIGFRLTGGSTEITGFDIDRVGNAVYITGGSEHHIHDNHLGWRDLAEGESAVGRAVAMTTGTGTVIEDNVARCVEVCFFLGDANNHAFSNVAVTNNRVNLFEPDSLVLLAKAGVQTSVPTTISGNWFGEVDSTGFGIAAIRSSASGTTISSNRIGVHLDGTSSNESSYTGVFVNAAKNVSVTGNTIVVAGRAVSVTGTDQTYPGPDNVLKVADPSDPVRGGAITGGDVTISSNKIGVLASGDAAERIPSTGVMVWGDAPRLTMSNNDVIARTAFELRTGTAQRVTSNRIGTERGTVLETSPIASGVMIRDVDDVDVKSNEMAHTDAAVSVETGASDVEIDGNDFLDTTFGVIAAGTEAAPLQGVVVSANTIEAKMFGVLLREHVDGAVISGNTIRPAFPESEVTGVSGSETATDTKIDGNTITAVTRGVVVSGSGGVIESNRIGVDATGAVDGSAQHAIVIDDDARIELNTIRATGGHAIVVNSDATGQLLGNAISGSSGDPIATATGPAAPTLHAVVDLPRVDDRVRTALVFTDVPTEAGTLEIFENGSCAGDPEAHTPLHARFGKSADRTWAIVTVLDRVTEDGFTATFSTAVNGTSAVSNCRERTGGTDTDGDGSLDELEVVTGTAGDPSLAVVVAESGAPLLIAAAAGRLQAVQTGSGVPPAPDGIELAYGVLGFEITDLPDGVDTVEVDIVDLNAEVTEGDTYWKYAPPAPGVAPSWFELSADIGDGPGAELVVRDTQGTLTRAWRLTLTDGGRGDLDGAANGTIVDPGGPASRSAVQASSLFPLTPVRVFESRSGEVTVDGEFEAIGRLDADSVTKVQVGGRGGVDAGAAAVAVNVTAIRPDGVGYVTLFPCGEDQPLTSSLNYRVGGVFGNSGIVKLNDAGELCVFTFAETDLVIDVNAWLAEAPSFESLTPARLAETRSGEVTVDGEAQELGRLDAGSVTEVQIAGRGGVDAGADAVALNVTAIRPDGVGYVTLYPCDEDRPTTSSLNYSGGGAVGNSAVVNLSADGKLCVFTFADTDLVLDVNAWLADDASFDPFVPARFFETRSGEATVDGEGNGVGRLDAKSVTTMQVAGRGDVPVGASAVALNVTAVRPGGVGYITLFPCDGDQPLTSSLNYAVGGAVGNSGIVKLSSDGTVCAYTQADTDLVIDVNAAWTG